MYYNLSTRLDDKTKQDNEAPIPLVISKDAKINATHKIMFLIN